MKKKEEAIIQTMTSLNSSYTSHSIVYETVIKALGKLTVNEVYAINALVISSKGSTLTSTESAPDAYKRLDDLEKKVDYLCNYILDDPDEIFSDESGA